MQVTLGFTPKDLQRLDDWAAARRLKRNAAVLALMDLAGVPTTEPLAAPSAAPVEVGTARAAQPDVGGRLVTRDPGLPYYEKVVEVPTSEKKEDLPLIRSPEDKAAALELLKSKLEKLPDVRGIHEAKEAKLPNPDSGHGAGDGFPGSDYPGYDEYDQGGGE